MIVIPVNQPCLSENSPKKKIVFDGFLMVYNPVNKSQDEDDSDDENQNSNKKQITLEEGDQINLKKLNSLQKYTKPPEGRFTEASLVKKVDEMGIGRPSTYSSMVSIVQDRKFAEKRDIKGQEQEAKQFIFDASTCELEEKSEKPMTNGEKGKLVPRYWNNCKYRLENNIIDIINFDFTVNLEKFLDEVFREPKTGFKW